MSAAAVQSADSWESFCAILSEESRALQDVNACALQLTQLLLDGAPQDILAADRALNEARARHAAACAKRRGMQARGFGRMTLQQVGAYVPRHLQPAYGQSLSELTCGSIALGITLRNNKSLIVAGLERLVTMTTKMQERLGEKTGVYKRRGFVPPVHASVLVSSHV